MNGAGIELVPEMARWSVVFARYVHNSQRMLYFIALTNRLGINSHGKLLKNDEIIAARFKASIALNRSILNWVHPI